MNNYFKRDFFLNLSSYLLCLMPLALITGPLIPEIFILVISITFIYFIIKKKKYKIFKKPK